MNNASSILVAGVIVVACVLLVKLCIKLGKAEIAEKRQKEHLTLQLHPSYRQKVAEDRAHELASRRLAIQERDAEHRRHLERTRVSPETWLIDHVPTSTIPLPSLKRVQVQEVEAETSEDSPPLKTFAQLLREGIVSASLQQNKLILGYVGNELRYGSWLDLYSCAIAGVTGSGKTTTVLFLLFQAILAGAKLVVIDPHLSDPEESLAARLMTVALSMALPPCDDTPSEALRRVRWFKSELARRKKYGIKTPALIFVIDEFNGVMRRPQIAEELPDLLLEIEQEGRKFGIFAMLIGQIWTRDTIGKAEIRQCLASAMVHRMGEAEQAKKLLSLAKYANMTVELETGHHLFKDTNGKFTEMVTPLTIDADAHSVAQLLPRSESPMDDLPLNQSTASEMTSAWRPHTQNGRHTESDIQRPGQPLDAINDGVSLSPEMYTKMIMVLYSFRKGVIC